MHDILVTIPVSLTELIPEVPRQLAEIVARLLEKEPERRYQSAEGLARDLETLGRLDDADQVYASIVRRCSDPVRLSVPTCTQISSLSQRNHQEQALAIALALLARLDSHRLIGISPTRYRP